MNSALIVLSSVFTIAATVPYMIEILKGKAKPRVASWFTWTAIQAIGAAAAFSSHQIPAAVYTLFCALECGAIVVMGLRGGERKFERLDYVCLAGAVVGLLALIFLKSPALAVTVSVATDLLGSIPTLKHAWLKPREETWITYALFGIGSGITLVIANFHFLTAFAYPLYLLVFDFLLTGIILLSPHRRALAPTSAAATTDAATQPHTTPVPTVQSTALIDSLVAANQDLWSMMPHSLWLQGLIKGTITNESLVHWAQQTQLLCLLEVEAFLRLRSHKPSEKIDTILAQLIEDTLTGNDGLLALLNNLGATVSTVVDPACSNYGNYLISCADDGLATGLIALCASERAYFDTCTAIVKFIPQESRLYSWITAWSDGALKQSLTEFESLIEAYVGITSAETLPSLNNVVRIIASCELDFWDMCWQQVSGPEVKFNPSSVEDVPLARANPVESGANG